MRRGRALSRQAAAYRSQRALPPAVRALALPLSFTILQIGVGLLPGILSDPHLLWSFWGAAGALLVWTAGLFAVVRRQGRRLAVEIVLRKQHYLQAAAQLSILLYWGWYWREVYAAAPLLVGQLAFAYAFDALLAWSRRDTYTFGFGPLPIVFSTNLFLWFKPEWFYLQFLMIGVGFTAKELVRWTKDGRKTHVFNPSSFPLMLFSVVMIITGRTDISWGPEIASTQLDPPYIYWWIFAVTLPAQILFGTASMTWAAVATAYGFELTYFAATGIHFFPERPIPIAVFLGMHLLFTDPSTSPRSELGRLIFGAMYGAGVVGCLALLTFLQVPTFYDKLLPVPILNLLIQRIDRVAGSSWLARLDPGRLRRGLEPRWRNAAYVSIWAFTFFNIQRLTGEDALLVRADSLLSRGRSQEALVRYREYLDVAPTDAEGLNNYGVALLQTGRLVEAVQSLKRSNNLRPDRPTTLGNLGLAQIRSGQAAEAVGTLERALQLQPNSPDILENLGQALLQTGRIEESIAVFQRAVARSPRNAAAHDSLGVALMEADSISEALRSFERANELEPDRPEILNSMGVALIRLQRFDAAVIPLQRAVRLRPDLAAPHDNLGQALMRSGRGDAALVAFAAAVERQPDSAEMLNHLGLALVQAGRPEDARVPLHRVVELRPTLEGHLNLGAASIQAGRVEEGIASFRRAVTLQPSSAEAHEGLATALMVAGRPAQALTAFRRAVALEPDNAERRSRLAEALAANDQPGAAASHLREALRLQPDYLPALTSLAWLVATEPSTPREPEEAVRLATRAAELSGRQDARVLQVLAAAYAAAGRARDAVAAAEAAEMLAVTASDRDLMNEIQAHLRVYRHMSGAR